MPSAKGNVERKDKPARGGGKKKAKTKRTRGKAKPGPNKATIAKRAKADLERMGAEHWIEDDPRKQLANQRLVKRALRWKTETTAQELKKLTAAKATPRELALATCVLGLGSLDEGVQMAAVRNIVTMEAQNQADEKLALEDERERLKAAKENGSQQHLHLHGVKLSGTKIIEALTRLDVQKETELATQRSGRDRDE